MTNEVPEIYELEPFESIMVGGVWVIRLPGGWGMYIKGQMLFVAYSEEFKPANRHDLQVNLKDFQLSDKPRYKSGGLKNDKDLK